MTASTNTSPSDSTDVRLRWLAADEDVELRARAAGEMDVELRVFVVEVDVELRVLADDEDVELRVLAGDEEVELRIFVVEVDVELRILAVDEEVELRVFDGRMDVDLRGSICGLPSRFIGCVCGFGLAARGGGGRGDWANWSPRCCSHRVAMYSSFASKPMPCGRFCQRSRRSSS